MSKATRNLFPMSVWDEASLLADFEEVGVKPKHLIKVLIKLYEDFSTGAIADLKEFEVPVGVPHKVYTVLRSGKYTLMTTRVIKREDSRDGATTKILLELQDGHEVECVLMRYSNTFTGDHKRTTLCVSSQVGCAMACTFCATGTMGLSGNLFGGEIIEQFIWANEVERIRNVVFMGMGEPLNNYDAVLSAIRAMTNSQWFALQQKRVTLSTVGIVPRMFQLFDEAPFVTMALSLHAPTQPMREKIVPSARQYKLEDLVRAIDHYSAATKKDMLIEYVLLDDVNASDETAHLLGQLLRGRNVLVNVIPFNPVLTKARHVAPSPERVASFAQIVASYGVLVTARKELGQDISGACGQLAVKTKKEKKRSAAAAKAAAEAAGEPAPVKDTLLDTAVSDEDDDDEQDDDDVDLIGNGLEGIASAMGVFNPASDDADAATTATVGTVADAEPTGCGSGSSSPADGAVADLEDLAGTAGASAAGENTVAAGVKGGLKKKRAAAAAAAAPVVEEEEVEAPLSAEDEAKSAAAAGHGCGDANCSCSRPAPERLTAEQLAALCPHDRSEILPYSRWVIARGPVNKSLPASVERGLSHKVRRERLQAEASAAAAAAAGDDEDAAAEAAEAGDSVPVSLPAPVAAVPASDMSDTTSMTSRTLPEAKDRRVFFPKGGLKRADPLAPLAEGAVTLDKLDAFTRVPEPAAEVDDASDDEDAAAAKLRRGRIAAAAAAAAAAETAFANSKKGAVGEQHVRERAPAAAWAALAVAAACAAGLYVRWMT